MENPKLIKANLRKLVSEDRIREVLSQLKALISEESDLYIQLIKTAFDYNNLTREHINQTLKKEEYRLGSNLIIRELLAIIDQLSEFELFRREFEKSNDIYGKRVKPSDKINQPPPIANKKIKHLKYVVISFFATIIFLIDGLELVNPNENTVSCELEIISIRNTAQDYIFTARAEKALKFVQTKINDDEIIVLCQRYQKLKNDRNSGLINYEEYKSSNDRIISSLLYVLEDLDCEELYHSEYF